MSRLPSFALLVLATGIAYGYEDETHSLLTERAFDASVLNTDGSLRADIGLDLGTVFTSSSGMSGDARTIVTLGTLLEDGCVDAGQEGRDNNSTGCDAGDPNAYNVFNHFLDTQQNIPLTKIGCTLGETSLNWATEINGQIPAMDRCLGYFHIEGQQFSYVDAQQYFLNAMTNASPSSREANMGLMLQSLGHVIHHLQDMAQPEHTRNDAHCGSPTCKSYFVPYDPSDRERYSADVTTSHLDQLLANHPYPQDVSLSSVSDFWEGGANAGMADFTSSNFISKDTNFTSNIGDPGPDSNHSLPDPDFTLSKWDTEVVTTQALAAMDLPQTDAIGSLNGSVTFVRQDVTDSYSGHVYENVRVSTHGLFTTDLPDGTMYSYSSFTQNPFNFMSEFEVLLPRAVAFSAGLVNHFFRTRLSAQINSTDFVVTNESDSSIDGTFTLYYEDDVETRDRLVSFDAIIGAGGESYAHTFTVPEPTAGFSGKYVVVFDGVMDGEPVVAADVSFGPDVPPIPCGGVVNQSGSSEGLGLVMHLGEVPGPVEVNFAAFYIPDALNIDVSGTTTSKVDTGGQVSGYHTYSFYHDPLSVNGRTSIDITVDGNQDTDTLWKLSVSCPSESADDLGLVPVRFQFSFEWVQQPCSYDLSVDGYFVGSFSGGASIGTGYSYIDVALPAGPHAVQRSGYCTTSGGPSEINFQYNDNAGWHPLPNGVIVVQ